jgi:hypothetical protein
MYSFITGAGCHADVNEMANTGHLRGSEGGLSGSRIDRKKLGRFGRTRMADAHQMRQHMCWSDSAAKRGGDQRISDNRFLTRRDSLVCARTDQRAAPVPSAYELRREASPHETARAGKKDEGHCILIRRPAISGLRFAPRRGATTMGGLRYLWKAEGLP